MGLPLFPSLFTHAKLIAKDSLLSSYLDISQGIHSTFQIKIVSEKANNKVLPEKEVLKIYLEWQCYSLTWNVLRFDYMGTLLPVSLEKK